MSQRLGVVVLASVLVVAAHPARAGLLSTPTNYSVFVFGDYTQQYVDSTGRVAVSGNMTVNRVAAQ